MFLFYLACSSFTSNQSESLLQIKLLLFDARRNNYTKCENKKKIYERQKEEHQKDYTQRKKLYKKEEKKHRHNRMNI